MDEVIIICHPFDAEFVKEHKNKIMAEVFERKGKAVVVSNKAFEPSVVHLFFNGDYMGILQIQDEPGVKRDESKLPTSVN